jgi:hypothetical protein
LLGHFVLRCSELVSSLLELLLGRLQLLRTLLELVCEVALRVLGAFQFLFQSLYFEVLFPLVIISFIN